MFPTAECIFPTAERTFRNGERMFRSGEQRLNTLSLYIMDSYPWLFRQAIHKDSDSLSRQLCFEYNEIWMLMEVTMPRYTRYFFSMIEILEEPMVSKNSLIWQPITANGIEMIFTMRYGRISGSRQGTGDCPCATRRTSIYKGLATLPYKCSRNCQWDESRSLGVGVQALASNPLQAAAVGNVNPDSSHVKSQCRTVLATSNAITCLWHCGMRIWWKKHMHKA